MPWSRSSFVSYIKSRATHQIIHFYIIKSFSLIIFITGDCGCGIIKGHFPVPLGQSKAKVNWPKPFFGCAGDLSPSIKVQETVQPDITSPYMFSVGEHKIIYTFTLINGMIFECHVFITVTGK